MPARACGFESHPGHHDQTQRLFCHNMHGVRGRSLGILAGLVRVDYNEAPNFNFRGVFHTRSQSARKDRDARLHLPGAQRYLGTKRNVYRFGVRRTLGKQRSPETK